MTKMNNLVVVPPNEKDNSNKMVRMLVQEEDSCTATTSPYLRPIAAPISCSPKNNRSIDTTPMIHDDPAAAAAENMIMTPVNQIVETSNWGCYSNPPPIRRFRKVSFDTLDNRETVYDDDDDRNLDEENKENKDQEQDNTMIVEDDMKSRETNNCSTPSSSSCCFLSLEPSVELLENSSVAEDNAMTMDGLNCIELDALPSLMIPDLQPRGNYDCTNQDDQPSFISSDDDDFGINDETFGDHDSGSTDNDDEHYQLYVQEEQKHESSITRGMSSCFFGTDHTNRSFTTRGAIEDDLSITITRRTMIYSEDTQSRLNLRPRKRKRGRTQEFPSSW